MFIPPSRPVCALAPPHTHRGRDVGCPSHLLSSAQPSSSPKWFSSPHIPQTSPGPLHWVNTHLSCLEKSGGVVLLVVKLHSGAESRMGPRVEMLSSNFTELMHFQAPQSPRWPLAPTVVWALQGLLAGPKEEPPKATHDKAFLLPIGAWQPCNMWPLSSLGSQFLDPQPAYLDGLRGGVRLQMVTLPSCPSPGALSYHQTGHNWAPTSWRPTPRAWPPRACTALSWLAGKALSSLGCPHHYPHFYYRWVTQREAVSAGWVTRWDLCVELLCEEIFPKCTNSLRLPRQRGHVVSSHRAGPRSTSSACTPHLPLTIVRAQGTLFELMSKAASAGPWSFIRAVSSKLLLQCSMEVFKVLSTVPEDGSQFHCYPESCSAASE